MWIEQRTDTWEEDGRYYARVRHSPIGTNGLLGPLDRTRKFRSVERRDRWVAKMEQKFSRARFMDVFW